MAINNKKDRIEVATAILKMASKNVQTGAKTEKELGFVYSAKKIESIINVACGHSKSLIKEQYQKLIYLGAIGEHIDPDAEEYFDPSKMTQKEFNNNAYISEHRFPHLYPLGKKFLELRITIDVFMEHS